MALDGFYNKIVAYQQFDIAQTATDIINENSEYLSTLLKSQLRLGKDGRGDNVTVFRRDEYSKYTINKKSKPEVKDLARVTQWITNYMTGAFYDSIYVFASEQTFLFDSDVPHFGDIMRQSGDVIMELNKENLEKFSREILKPELQRRFKLKMESA